MHPRQECNGVWGAAGAKRSAETSSPDSTRDPGGRTVVAGPLLRAHLCVVCGGS